VTRRQLIAALVLVLLLGAVGTAVTYALWSGGESSPTTTTKTN
jgi:hypothetical protein